jgi:transcriptional regulator with XRE-family HTH domain
MESLRHRLARLMREYMDTTMVDTQTKVSAKAGVSQSTVQRLLSQDQSATVDVLESLAKAFGVKSAHYLLLERDEAKLLSLWGTLSNEDRQTVLGFIQMKAQTKTVQDLAAQLTFDSGKPVSPELRAASKRASVRKPGSDALSNPTDDKARSTSRARRKA